MIFLYCPSSSPDWYGYKLRLKISFYYKWYYSLNSLKKNCIFPYPGWFRFWDFCLLTFCVCFCIFHRWFDDQWVIAWGCYLYKYIYIFNLNCYFLPCAAGMAIFIFSFWIVLCVGMKSGSFFASLHALYLSIYLMSPPLSRFPPSNSSRDRKFAKINFTGRAGALF